MELVVYKLLLGALAVTTLVACQRDSEIPLETVEVSKAQLDQVNAESDALRKLTPPDSMEAEGRLDFFHYRRANGPNYLNDPTLSEFDPKRLVLSKYPLLKNLQCELSATGEDSCTVNGIPVSADEIQRSAVFVRNEDVHGLGGSIVCGQRICIEAGTKNLVGVIQPAMRAFNSQKWYANDRDSVGEQ